MFSFITFFIDSYSVVRAVLSVSSFDKSNMAYWQIWINGTKGYVNKKIKKHYNDRVLDLILENSNLGK